MNYEECDYCMRRKCKNCEIGTDCVVIDHIHENRLMWHPFENLKEVMEKKHDKQKDSLHLVAEKEKKAT